jgi:hypothetical protein
MEANASDASQANVLPSKSKRNRNIAIILVVVVIAVVVILLVVNNANQNQYQSTAHLTTTSVNTYQYLAGPTMFTIQVSNDGGAYGSGTLTCTVNTGAYTYSNFQTVSLDAGSSTTVNILVATSFGTTVTNSMCSATF